MGAGIVRSLALTILVGFSVPAASAAPLPGEPLGGGPFGSVDILPGVNVLPSPVTTGDVVLLENPSGGTDRTNWSDVVRFFNDQFTFTGVTRTLGIAYSMSDGETGLPNIALVNGVTAFVTLPDALNTNNLFIQETLVGSGADSDITPYSPSAGSTYNVHSDAALTPDRPDVVIQPGTLIVPPPGMMNKPHVMLPPIIETAAETDAAGPAGVHRYLT